MALVQWFEASDYYVVFKRRESVSDWLLGNLDHNELSENLI